MKILLIINAIFEGVFGGIAIAAPQVVWAGGDALALANGRAFGVAALAIALLGLLSIRHVANKDALRVVLSTMVFWHAGLTAIQAVAMMQHLTPPPVVAIHGGFMVAFVVFFMRSRSAST